MSEKDRAPRQAQTIDHTAVKFIRMVLASYIMAVGIGLINGFDAQTYFQAFLPERVSSYLGSAFVVFCAWMLFLGYFLRLVSLCLAIVIFTSSVQINVIAPVTGSIDAFWNDLVLICGLMATYCTLSEAQLREQAVVTEPPRTQYVLLDDTVQIVPRSLAMGETQSLGYDFRSSRFTGNDETKKTMDVNDFAASRPKPTRANKSRRLDDDQLDDMENIFA